MEIVDVPAMRVALVKARCQQDMIGETMKPLFGQLGPIVQPIMAGPPMCFYTEWGETDCEIALAAPIHPDAEPRNAEIWDLDACRAAKYVHVGHYDGLMEAWQKAWVEFEHSSLIAGGAPFEVYQTDPELEPDPNRWITEIFIPLA